MSLGIFYIVPTPIGNLSDMSQRAIDTLNNVDYIAAEDTRHSGHLLQHFNIKTKMFSVHDHNETQRITQIVEYLQAGKSIALISDAGTPLINDPGYHVIKTCRDLNLPIVALPGPCALITALSGAGLPTDRFTFEGFMPVKEVAKRKALEQAKAASATSIYYEAPRRVLATMLMCEEVLEDDREVVLVKELTKTFETFVNGTSTNVVKWLQQDSVHQKGEFVLIISGTNKRDDEDIPADAIKMLRLLLTELPLKKAAALTANYFGLKKNALYQVGLSFSSQ